MKTSWVSFMQMSLQRLRSLMWVRWKMQLAKTQPKEICGIISGWRINCESLPCACTCVQVYFHVPALMCGVSWAVVPAESSVPGSVRNQSFIVLGPRQPCLPSLPHVSFTMAQMCVAADLELVFSCQEWRWWSSSDKLIDWLPMKFWEWVR